ASVAWDSVHGYGKRSGPMSASRTGAGDGRHEAAYHEATDIVRYAKAETQAAMQDRLKAFREQTAALVERVEQAVTWREAWKARHGIETPTRQRQPTRGRTGETRAQ